MSHLTLTHDEGKFLRTLALTTRKTEVETFIQLRMLCNHIAERHRENILLCQDNDRPMCQCLSGSAFPFSLVDHGCISRG